MKWDNKKDTERLLDFIIKQELDLKDYQRLQPMINEKFMICKTGKGIQNFTNELIDDIIDWENGNQHSSLQHLICSNYVVFTNP